MKPENRTPLLKIADVATYCSVSEKAVRRWIAAMNWRLSSLEHSGEYVLETLISFSRTD